MSGTLIIVIVISLICHLCVASSSSSRQESAVVSLHTILSSENLTGVASYWRGDAVERLGSGVHGFSDPYQSRLIDVDSRYPVASNTKLYVTIALYQLQENGKLNLSDSVSDYLTNEDFISFGFPNISRYCPVVGYNSTQCETVTFTQLLAMSAGLPDTPGYQFLPYPGSIAAFIGMFINVPLLFTPGAQYYYSNPSFMLSAYLIEKLSGLSFEQYLKDHIFSVVGLKDTYYDPYNGKFGIDQRRVGEYFQYIDPSTKQLVANGLCSSEYDLGSASGAGGLVSSQADEARLYFSLFNFSNPQTMGQPLLSNPQSLLDIVKARTFINGNLYYAQGLFVNANGVGEFPIAIQYEGEIVCSHTLNYLNISVTPPTLVQVWSAVRVAYVTEAQLANISSQRTGNFFGIFGSLPQRASLFEVAQKVSALFD